jgi:hypothetical protein
MNKKKEISAGQAGQVSLGKEITVNRLGFGAMRLLMLARMYARRLKGYGPSAIELALRPPK